MITHVMGEVDFVNEVTIFSDKCTNKDFEKLEQEFAKDLTTTRYRTKAMLSKFIQNGPGSRGGDADESDDDDPKKQELNTETTVSLNPKINMLIAPGFARQIEFNTTLLQFRLIYYTMHPKGWKRMGEALANNKTLLQLTINGCNLWQDQNLQLLFSSETKDKKDTGLCYN